MILGLQLALPCLQVPWPSPFMQKIICFLIKRKKKKAKIQQSLQFYVIVLEKPSAEKWHGCHSKKSRLDFGRDLRGRYLLCRSHENRSVLDVAEVGDCRKGLALVNSAFNWCNWASRASIMVLMFDLKRLYTS